MTFQIPPNANFAERVYEDKKGKWHWELKDWIGGPFPDEATARTDMAHVRAKYNF